LILIGITTPSDLSTNRLFTREFFVLAKSRLRNGGILTLTLPGSLTYYSQELKDLNASILNSLKGSYNFVRLIPGDYNIFIASDSAQILKVNAALISQRLIVQNINTNILTPPYLQYRLDKMWLDWFNSSISKAVKVSNQDLRPLAVFKMLLFWNKQFSPRFTRVLELAEKINLRAITIVISIFTLVLFYLFRSRKEPSRLCLAYSIATTGFFGMLANLLLTFSFQVFYGYLYRMIGLLVSVFMAGIAAGGIYISRNIGRLNNARRPLIILESIILFFTFLLAVAITNSAEILERLPLIFTLLFFIPGFLMGLEFSLVSRMYLGKRQEAGQVAGLLYAADLLGGWLAGILGGIILLPILGFYNACLIIVLLKASSLILLLVFKDVH
jgi:spermidine synthase